MDVLALASLSLVCAQSLTFWFYRAGWKPLATWALAGCLVIMVGAVILEFGMGLVPATEEKQRITQSAFFTHLLIAAVEFVVFVIACLSAGRSGGFWVAWWLSLTMIAAFLAASLYSLSAPLT